MVHYPAGITSGDGYTVVIKGWTCSATILSSAVLLNFKLCSIGTKGPKVCQENIPHTITPPPPAWTVETRQDGSMLSCSLRQILTLLSQKKSRLIRPGDVFQSSTVQFWWACVNCRLRFLFLSDRSGSRCGLLLLESICFRVRRVAFRDGILHTLVVTSGYLSYCCLSIISNQSAHSPLTSDINKAFSSTQLPLTGYFLFFRPFSVNPRDGCVWKSQ